MSLGTDRQIHMFQSRPRSKLAICFILSNNPYTLGLIVELILSGYSFGAANEILTPLIMRINDMIQLKYDLFVGLLIAGGIVGFISGQFIVSTLLFASASVFVNILYNRRQSH